MSRKGENIFRRKDGRWEARYIHHYENGIARYRSLYGKTYSEVKAKKLFALSLPESQKEPSTTQAITVGELALLWLSDVRMSVKESTYTRYHRITAKYLLPHLGEIPLFRLDAVTVNAFSESLLAHGGLRNGELSPKSVSDILCVLKSILRFGIQCGYPCGNLEGIRYPQKAGRQIDVLSVDNRTLLERVLLTSESETALGILLALFTGIRIGELCGLRWEDVDLSHGTISIRRTVERIADLDPATARRTKIIICEPKTECSVRAIPIPRFLLAHLRSHARSAEKYVATGSESFIEPHAFYLRYRQFMRLCGMDVYSFHALRHTFATHCVEMGFDTKSLSEILGHSNISTTLAIYVHPTMEQKRLQMDRLAPQSYLPSNSWSSME